MRNGMRICRKGRREGGAVLFYSLAAIILLTLIAALAVDWGRALLVKTELQSCADAAARAGVARLRGTSPGDGPAAAVYAANWTALLNAADGVGVSLDPAADVEVGNWSATAAPKFLAGRTPYNAVRVTARRSQARGSAVPMALSANFGLTSIDVHASAIARTYPVTAYGLIGIDRIRFASLGVLARVTGNFYSNGDIDVGTPVGLLVSVQGDAKSYAGTVRRGSLASITGSTARLTQRLEFPPVTLPASNDNSRIASLLNSNGDLTGVLGVRIPAGRYVVRDLTLLAGIGIDIQGPVEFVVTRNFNVAAGVNLLGSTSTRAADFKVRVLNGGHVNFLANLPVPVYMDVYAPESDININVGVNRFTGALVGRTLDINVPVLSQVVQDATLTDPGPSVDSVSLVE